MFSMLVSADAAQGGDAVIRAAALNLISTVIGLVVGAVVTTVVAFIFWKRQQRLQTGFETATAFLGATYAVRAAITRVRRGQSLSWPDSSEAQPDGYSRLESAYREHWSWVRDALSALYPRVPMAEVLCGDEVGKVLQSLDECARRLLVALWMYFEHQSGAKRQDEKKLEDLERIIYEPVDDEVDEFGLKLEQAVEHVKQLVRPHLQMKSRAAATGSSHRRTSCGASAKQDKPVDRGDKQQH